MNEQFINDLSKELAKLGTIHSVGEEWISYTGKIPSGGIPYCGQEITRETYSALWSWVQAQGLVKTESEWQSIASSQNGNVPFYSSGNGTTTFRMPKLVGYVKGASSQSESGSYVAEGLPNITGGIPVGVSGYKDQNVLTAYGNQVGALFGSSHSRETYRLGSGVYSECPVLNFDASRSNAIYGNSGHVTPETSVVLFGVYAFGTVSNPNDLNVSNLAAEVDSIKTSYLPSIGGTVTGEIKQSGDFATVSQSVNNGKLLFNGGTAYGSGASISLSGESRSGNEGQFAVVASDGTNTKTLLGKPSGSLTWGGNDFGWMAMPSVAANRVLYTVSQGGQAFVAPKNGYFVLTCTRSGSSAWAQLYNTSADLITYTPLPDTSALRAKMFLPVAKGQTVKPQYSNITIDEFYFVPCQASV